MAAMQNLCNGFIDVEKAYDLSLRPKLWSSLPQFGVISGHIKIVQDVYHGAKTRIKTARVTTNSFIVRVGIHQGPAHVLTLHIVDG